MKRKMSIFFMVAKISLLLLPFVLSDSALAALPRAPDLPEGGGSNFDIVIWGYIKRIGKWAAIALVAYSALSGGSMLVTSLREAMRTGEWGGFAGRFLLSKLRS